jgi:hypothetical protein
VLRPLRLACHSSRVFYICGQATAGSPVCHQDKYNRWMFAADAR